MHGEATPRLPSDDPVARRIARLSEEFLSAPRARREAIGAEIRALATGNVVPLPRKV